jgi:energy-coupling factor transporter transmembrane protein EcfT
LAFHKRSIFLINPKFQLKFCLIVCSVVLISTLIYPVIIYDFFDLLTDKIPDLSNTIVTAKKEMIMYLVIIQIVVLSLVFLIFIFLTHKVAGPLFKLKSHIYSIRSGAPISPVVFRTGDYFQDVAEELNLFLESVSTHYEDDFGYLEEVADYINNLNNVVPDDKKPILNEISRKLLDIKVRYKKHL